MRGLLFVWLALAQVIWAEPFDLGDAFRSHLLKLGPIPAEALQKQAREPKTGLDWDPTTARYWSELNTKPVDPGRYIPGKPDLSLSADEVAKFKKNGFVVSERLGRDTVTGLLYRIYHADLPVFVTADSILYAWHQSFNDACTDIELSFLAPTFADVLKGMHDALPEAQKSYGRPNMLPALRDADLILTVALSLEEGREVDSGLGGQEQVRSTLALCKGLTPEFIIVCGRKRYFDFGALKIRGRYENFPKLHGYFRAVAWFQQMGLQLNGSEREMQTALVLADLLNRSRRLEEWRKFERVQNKLVGESDGASLLQLADLLTKQRSPLDFGSVKREIQVGSFGVEQLASYRFYGPDAGEVRPDRVCYLTGARFLYDSWLFNQVTFGRVEWNGKRVRRRLPSGLDVCFAVLGNNAVTDEIVRRIREPGVPWRDGLPYQHNLMAAKLTLDSVLEQEQSSQSLSTQWLQVLRALSDEPDSRAPQVVQTTPWRLRLANTQLASWAELRHTFLLDAKPTFTDGELCSYPYGYVEPNPEFWRRFAVMSRQLSLLGEEVGTRRIQTFYRSFAETAQKLEKISEKQLAQQPLSEEETKFLRDMVETDRGRCGRAEFTGWYFGLFYDIGGNDFPIRWQPTVADAHLSPKDEAIGAPEMILLEGVGTVDLLVVAIENGGDKCVYLGPTASYYEWHAQGRLADSEWEALIERSQLPPRPAWTNSYLSTVK